jgi:FkbM family methyltransferase
MKVLDRLWNMSPRELTGAVLRHAGLVGAPDRPVPGWHRIDAGPIAGAELYVAPEAVDTWRAMIAGVHDQHLFDALARYCPLDGLVCWDVGAHFGYHSLSFAALAQSSGQVIAFEPNPANVSRLVMHLEHNPALASRIKVRPMALSDSEGRAAFRFSDHVESGMSTGGYLASATPPNDPSSYKWFRSILVETSTVDRLVKSEELPAPDVMKIDVEGAEAAVLRGGRNVIPCRRPILLIEVHHILQMLEVCQLLSGWRYVLEALDREHATPGRCFILARPGSPHE